MVLFGFLSVVLCLFACCLDVLFLAFLVDSADYSICSFLWVWLISLICFFFFLFACCVSVYFYASVGLSDCLLHVCLFCRCLFVLFLLVFFLVICLLAFSAATVVLCLFAFLLHFLCCVLWGTVLMVL